MPFPAKKLVLITLCFLIWSCPVMAQTPTDKAQFPVEITSDRLESNPDEQFVEFIGNVKVLYDTYRINSNTLRIYYEQSKDPDNQDPLAVSGIKVISARGNVVIRSEEYDIDADRADYTMATGMAVFTGKEVKVVQDKNIITGTKITIDRNKGRVTVDGDEKTRIKAIFYTDEKLDMGL